MIDNTKLVKLRASFIGESTPDKKLKGYFKNIYYTIWIKQQAEKFLVKRADERTKGESRLEYDSFWDLTEDWIFGVKFIT